MARDITEKMGDAFPLVLSVMGGAVVFTGMLLPKLQFPLEFDYIHLSRYNNKTVGGEMQWRVAPRESVKDRVVLVLDDILDEGETMAAIRQRIMDMGAKEFHAAVLCEKTLTKLKPMHPISAASRCRTATSLAAAWTSRATGATGAIRALV
jgi:hypoxanthine phosphoribosyltransferase